MPIRIPRIQIWSTLTETERATCLRRPTRGSLAQIRGQAQEIIRQVRSQGDRALHELNLRFDGTTPTDLEVPRESCARALRELPAEARSAIELAADNIARFHRQQLPATIAVETAPGVLCERHWRPIQRVGLYVPGGSAPLISTVLMLGIPARVAGVPYRILCTPPHRDGEVHPAVLAAAELAGVQQIFCVGGAQAIAAMAYGTESIPKVDKVFGPGNPWVTEAKLLCALDPEGADLDMPAGPSEVMVIADASANPSFVAADLLSQAEHGEDSQVFLVSTEPDLIAAVANELDRQVVELPRRNIAEACLANARLVIATDLDEAIEIANAYAPEHLLLQVEKPELLRERVRAAGSVFLGHLSPESAGDYASGTNHVLPTDGWAAKRGGLCVEAFMRPVTFQQLTPEGVASLARAVEALAALEGLDAHRHAMGLRRRFCAAASAGERR